MVNHLDTVVAKNKTDDSNKTPQILEEFYEKFVKMNSFKNRTGIIRGKKLNGEYTLADSIRDHKGGTVRKPNFVLPYEPLTVSNLSHGLAGYDASTWDSPSVYKAKTADKKVTWIYDLALENPSGINDSVGSRMYHNVPNSIGLPTLKSFTPGRNGVLSDVSVSTPVEAVKRYSVSDLKNNTDKIYVFGDNMLHTGKGGQAIVRDEANAFGIRTKAAPSSKPDAYFYDEFLEENKEIIDADIAKIKADGRPVVFPQDGVGTGLALLKEKAPRTLDYLNKALQDNFGFNNSTGAVTKRTGATIDPNVKIGIDNAITALKEAQADGQKLKFNVKGYGQYMIGFNKASNKTDIAKQTFLYLSKQLLEEFNFINPGYLGTEVGIETIQSNKFQPISDALVLDFMKHCK
jgi:hypothetical protein